MKWYRNLYVGEKAKKVKYKIFGRIVKKKFPKDAYLIILADNKDNLLEIIRADLFNQPYYKKKSRIKNIYVVGLAVGYNEALELTRSIIDDVYTNTKCFDIPRYLKFGQKMQQNKR